MKGIVSSFNLHPYRTIVPHVTYRTLSEPLHANAQVAGRLKILWPLLFSRGPAYRNLHS